MLPDAIRPNAMLPDVTPHDTMLPDAMLSDAMLPDAATLCCWMLLYTQLYPDQLKKFKKFRGT